MEKIWLKSYPQHVPAEINPSAYQSIVDLFRQSTAEYSTHVAYENMGTSLTYAALNEQVQSFAAYLQEALHCKAGTRIALMMPNILQYPICLFGALKAGLIVVNVNPQYTPRELLHQLNDSGAEVIVVLENFASTLEEVLTKTKIKHVITTQIGDCFPVIKKTLVNIAVKYIKKMVPPFYINQSIPLTRVLRQGKSIKYIAREVRSEDIAFLQYTGGTTGISKGAILTHRNIIANLEQASAWVAPFLTKGQEVIVTPLPLYHIFSLTANCLLFLKVGAKNVLITNPRDMKGFIRILKKLEKFTALTGVNTLFNGLVNQPDFLSLDFSQFKLALGGGMAVQRAVAERWEKVTGHPLLEAYGLTETSPAVTINPLTLAHYNGAIGLPIPSTEISIRNDKDEELSVDEVGELCVRGPQVMRAYWNQPEETSKVFTKDGYLRTGDLVSINVAGFLTLHERKKDMIVISGFNVYPNEVEDVIALHPAVLEVAVVGVPDIITGEVVKAFVVKKDPDLSKEALINYCREYLTAYKIPKLVEFCTELPKSNVGKILRRKLRTEEQSTKESYSVAEAKL
jgi:long-chain acyl-CoA synthetase